MKLYLSSYKLGNHPDELLQLFGDRPKTIAYIPNALDFTTDLKRKEESVAYDVSELKRIGLTVDVLDLREYFNKPATLTSHLSNYSAVFVRGGNCFVLRRAFRQSGLDSILPDLLRTETLIYSGYSAGIDMLAPSLHGAEFVDNPNAIPDGYQPNILWECLGLLPYTVAPHYKSDHHESDDMDKSITHMIDNHIPFIALRDGEAIVVDGGIQSIVT